MNKRNSFAGLLFLLAAASGLLVPTWMFTAAAYGSGKDPAAVDKVPAGLSAADWRAIRAEYEHNRRAAVRVGGAYQARNPRQQWLADFDGRGFSVQPDGGDWRWGLELDRYGFAGQEHRVQGRAQMMADKERVTYAWDGTMEEWFVNGEQGLEHGFTVRRRPDGQTKERGPLAMHLGVRGGLYPLGQPDRHGVSFVDEHGQAVVQYAGLKAWDADGKSVAARLEPAGAGLRLELEERGARYPITIDPIAQQAYLKASNTEAGSRFGNSVAVSGDTVVVGAWLRGAAYVFTRSGNVWSEQAFLQAPNGGGLFGSSVAVSGDTVVVGAWDESGQAGAAYVFVRNGTVWSQQAYLKASNADPGDVFGVSVAVSGDTVVVGAPGEASKARGVNGNQKDDSAPGAGAAYVFVRNGTTWSQRAYLKASTSSQFFGVSVAISGNTVVVGASGETVFTGAAYIFVGNGTVWSHQAPLKASNSALYDEFGGSVAVSGDTVAVGAPGRGGLGQHVGGAYVFVRNGTSWSQQADIPSNIGSSYFGNSVAVLGDTLVVGAFNEPTGAAYVFVRNGTLWSQQTFLKASNAELGDGFGASVALSGETVVVGAPEEDSSANDMNGDQNDNSAPESGAAYIFTTSSTPTPCPMTFRVMMKPNILSPADQRLVQVTADLRVNPCVQNPKFKLISVKSSDPGNGLFRGDIPWEIRQASFGTDDRQFLLRAEAKPGSTLNPRRTYTATFDVTDALGRKKRITGEVKVP